MSVEAEGSDERGLEELFRATYPRLVRIGVAMTGDIHLAEELAQEAFARSWRALERLRDPGAAPAYVTKTLVNLVRRNLRRRVLERVHRVTGSAEATEPDPTGRLAMLHAIRALPPRQRACVALRYYEDLSEQDTALALGVSVGTVKSQTYKALKRLETMVGRHD